MNKNKKLPYDFDLQFDLKSRKQLAETLYTLRSKQKDIEHLMRQHKISLSDAEIEELVFLELVG